MSPGAGTRGQEAAGDFDGAEDEELLEDADPDPESPEGFEPEPPERESVR